MKCFSDRQIAVDKSKRTLEIRSDSRIMVFFFSFFIGRFYVFTKPTYRIRRWHGVLLTTIFGLRPSRCTCAQSFHLPKRGGPTNDCDVGTIMLRPDSAGTWTLQRDATLRQVVANRVNDGHGYRPFARAFAVRLPRFVGGTRVFIPPTDRPRCLPTGRVPCGGGTSARLQVRENGRILQDSQPDFVTSTITEKFQKKLCNPMKNYTGKKNV